MTKLTTGAIALIMLTSLLVVGPGQAEEHEPYEKMTDVYVEMDDGVEIATDIYVPTGPDRDGDGLYPCVVELTPYRKESRASEGAGFLPEQGIALIEVDARGTGGSQGEYDIVFSVREQADAAALVDWAAEQATGPDGQLLCEDTVGMYGGSYSGIIQYLVASLPEDPAQGDDLPAAPEHLAAIAPQRAYGDLYRDIVYHGGQLILSFGVIWAEGTSAFYLQPPTNLGTPHGNQAWVDHLTKNDQMLVPYLNNQYADDRWCSDDSDTAYCQDLYTDSSALPRIEDMTVPTLHLAGFYDSFTRGQLLTFQEAYDLEQQDPATYGPNFLIVGPWNHGGTHFIDPDQGFQQELADWYHWFLEDRANGDEPAAWIEAGFDPGQSDGEVDRVKYFQMRSTAVNPPMPPADPEDGTWQTAPDWPLPGTDMARLYLRAGGHLSSQPPGPDEGFDTYAYNPSAGYTETMSRWDNAAGVDQSRRDQSGEDASGVTYVTDRLDQDVTLAGPIALKLHATTFTDPGSTAGAELLPGATQAHPPWADTDFVVKVSEVAPDGTATLITQGYLRASHQAVDAARSHVLDGELVSPFHPHTAETLDPPEVGQVETYNVEIWPTAKTFREDHRLRLDIMSADTPNHLNLAKPAVNLVHHDADHASYLAVPLAPAGG